MLMPKRLLPLGLVLLSLFLFPALDAIAQCGQCQGPCDNTIRGTSSEDYLVGTEGNDCICGRGGDDVLIGKGGDDCLDGGGGDDVLRGDAGDDTLLGRGGDDVLRGGPGNDILEGGRADDLLNGGAHTVWDQCDGGRGDNRLRKCEEEPECPCGNDTAGGDSSIWNNNLLAEGCHIEANGVGVGVYIVSTGHHLAVNPRGMRTEGNRVCGVHFGFPDGSADIQLTGLSADGYAACEASLMEMLANNGQVWCGP